MPAYPLAIVAYLSLFAGVGLVFLFVNLLVGKLVRPNNPHDEKLEIYECGEPTIGSSFVQFDLRFYVVALLFIIFDVEVAFFFPWAAVFGKSTNLANQQAPAVTLSQPQSEGETPQAVLGTQTYRLYRELGIRAPRVPELPPVAERGENGPYSESLTNKAESAGNSALDQSDAIVREGFRELAKLTLLDIGIFFAVLMVGFFYVWKRGDLDWVRALSEERSKATTAADDSGTVTQESVLSA